MKIYLVEYNFVAGNIRYNEPFDPQAIKAAGYDAVYMPSHHAGRDNQTRNQDYAAAKAAGLGVGWYCKIVDGALSYGKQMLELGASLQGRVFDLPPAVFITGEQSATGHKLRGDLSYTLIDFIPRYKPVIALNSNSYYQLLLVDKADPDLPAFIAQVKQMRLWSFQWGVNDPITPAPWSSIYIWGRGDQDNVTEWGEPTNPTPEPDPDADTKPNFMVSRDDLLKVVDALRKAIEAL